VLILCVAGIGCRRSGQVEGGVKYDESILRKLEDERPVKYLTMLGELPRSVRAAVFEAIKSDDRRIADRGTLWNKTDTPTDPSLPYRRLIWAAEVKQYYVIHYEKGGEGWSTCFLIISPEEKAGKKSLVWAGVSFNVAGDYSAFLRLMKEGKVHSDPRIGL
jgi:hypothetical protein